MKKVSETPSLMLAPPRQSQDKPYWVSLLRNLFGIFSSHAEAINLLYENFEEDTEYLIPNRTVNGKPVYVQKFSSFAGPNGSAGTPAAVTVNHNISGLNEGALAWLNLYGRVRISVTSYPICSTSFAGATALTNSVGVSSTFISWQTNYDARTHTCHPILEYQKS